MTLLKTSLHACHVQAGARLVPFAGWEMPVQYSGVVEEHRAVRERAGLFDVSHMGEIEVRGSGALDFLQALTPNDVAALEDGQAQYSALLTERGTFLDDMLVYRYDRERFLLVVNAGGRQADLAWIERQRAGSGHADDTIVEDQSETTALIALQGPESAAILSPHVGLMLSDLGYYRFARSRILELDVLVSRTGYTGEDGFELYLDADGAPRLWDLLHEAGRDHGLLPAGLGARDTLRLEAGMMLAGQDIDDTTTPLEAGLSWIVKLDKGDFVGRDALVEQKERGVDVRLRGFEVLGRGIARHGYSVSSSGRQVGTVTSGSWSPTLERAIGIARVPADLSGAGTELDIDVRGRTIEAQITKMPFYRRER